MKSHTDKAGSKRIDRASVKQRASRKANAESRKIERSLVRQVNPRRIKAGSIKIDLPAVQQRDNYSCGAGAFMSIALHYNAGPTDIEEYKAEMGTNPDGGTYYKRIVEYANRLGLNAKVEIGMTKRRLKKLLDQRIPVMLSMQAYALDESEYDNPDMDTDGHYIDAVGYDDEDCFYFMDPSITGSRGFLSWEELNKRWQENEGTGEREFYRHLGIVIRPGKRRTGPHAWRIV